MPSEDGVCIEVHHDTLTRGVQVRIGDGGGGYRILGPKFSGSSTRLARRRLDARDIAEVRRWLDKAEKALPRPPEVA